MQEFYLFLNHLETPQLLRLTGLRAFGAIVSTRQTEGKAAVMHRPGDGVFKKRSQQGSE